MLTWSDENRNLTFNDISERWIVSITTVLFVHVAAYIRLMCASVCHKRSLIELEVCRNFHAC